ncbi:MAG: hypothetical protein LHW64_04375 [Candidatus Cloacimonetes bacterium]|jgi:hypothetical protein|nr:hypothetical protein [Candidatus Cloacimonadota bacterium]MCB5287022.1 hypothetical protein [Candidatus Cloacimonadota bacterium]MCK9184305.1 hypothetical protein [Candidatus Cloacimonadota bacterium]MCK9583436.1 hypothetical protein [Candidatus Cloacimonadota bacterium]MDY0229342.1 hypothetical protein [Candidatus Cloacimonadaceae bacterium]
MCKSLNVKAALLLLMLFSMRIVWGQNTLAEILQDIPQVTKEADMMLRLHNRDVIAYNKLKEHSSELKQKNFAKTEEYQQLLSELEELRKTYYSNKIYVKTELSFGKYKLQTGKVQASISCPADLLSRASHNMPMLYFDDGHVFNGICFPALPLVLLPFSDRAHGTEWYALDLKVSEDVAALLEDAYVDVYLIGKISSSKQAKMRVSAYWGALDTKGGYPSPTFSKSVPVVEQFNLVLVDRSSKEIIYQRNFSNK